MRSSKSFNRRCCCVWGYSPNPVDDRRFDENEDGIVGGIEAVGIADSDAAGGFAPLMVVGYNMADETKKEHSPDDFDDFDDYVVFVVADDDSQIYDDVYRSGDCCNDLDLVCHVVVGYFSSCRCCNFCAMGDFYVNSHQHYVYLTPASNCDC